ncbi:enterochelin esterase domain-containing protein [Nocardiopsis sp. LOL_012]|uniref:enterochelin esterase domain-containing protein n=1 Tax=Nocardiopsis sp. LOL_012 TaxID=3345409 RepID=UPI003A866B52
MRTHAVPPRLKRTVRPERVPTPRVDEVAKDPEGVWAFVRRSGTPLVGEADDEGRRTVTFLWRGGDGLADVLLVANKIADADSYGHCRMERVPGTDVWHLTYRMRGDWRSSYTVAPVPAGAAAGDPADLPETLRVRRERAMAVSEPGDRPAVARWFAALAHTVPDPFSRERLDCAASVVSLPEAPKALGSHAAPARRRGRPAARPRPPVGGTYEWSLLDPGRRLRDALDERGGALGHPPFSVVLEEYHGGHDRACWRAGLPGALAFVTHDWER